MQSPHIASLIIGATALLLVGCSSAAEAPTAPAPHIGSEPASDCRSTDEESAGPAVPDGSPTVIASGLEAPWSVVRLGEGDTGCGSSLISERDSGIIKELGEDGSLRDLTTVEGIDAAGEGGLLGLAAHTIDGTTWLYAYGTTASDNRIVRMELGGTAGTLTVGEVEPIVTGIAKAGNHNGGRIAFGPDGRLYATTGDAGEPQRAQDEASLNGKILRIEADGSVPDDNPFGDSLVYTIGHRNPQGLAWGDDGTMYSSEFGQNTWDELNIITAGQNYGWPVHEGIANAEGYVNPIEQWSTDEASPSGLAHTRGTLHMAALRGERLWSIHVGLEGVSSAASYTGEFGRMRDAVEGPDGTLWVLTNNTDGRGDPRDGDDKLLQVALKEGSPG